jgi:hypothetical protein
MRNDQVTLDDSEDYRQLREELPGSWYNYELSEITLNSQEFDHWLNRLEDQLTLPLGNQGQS